MNCLFNLLLYTGLSNLAHYVPSYGPFHFYSATKHAVRALTEGLRQELRALKSPIKVTCVSPGLVKSSIFKNSMGESFDKHLYENYPSISPSDVASTIEFVLATPPHVQVIQFLSTIFNIHEIKSNKYNSAYLLIRHVDL